MTRFLTVFIFFITVGLCFGRQDRSMQTDRCSAAGENYCYSCNSVGVCVDDEQGGFYLDLVEDCTVACEEPQITVATCSPNALSYCGCDPVDVCKEDPLNAGTNPGGSMVVCTTGAPQYIKCEPYQTVNTNTCDCVDVDCPSTGPCPGAYLPPYENGCGIFYYCSQGDFVEETCIEKCFNVTACECF